MCNCNNIKIGSYKNQIEMVPWWSTKPIAIDKCLQEEIQFLWNNKIRTTGCCCGHNKITSMINVIPEDHIKMINLGYKYWVNTYGVICYKLLSINNIPKRFTIFSSTININFDNIKLSKEEVLGSCDFNNNDITLCNKYKEEDLSNDCIIDTFYHEKIHIILDAMGEHKLSNNEKFVEVFSRLLRQTDESTEY